LNSDVLPLLGTPTRARLKRSPVTSEIVILQELP
jgi:hypothetical protein